MRLLHTMLRVGDLQKSIDFYTRVMGMELLRTTDRPEQQYSLAFVGYGGNPGQAEIELTYNHDGRSYEHGSAFGHLAFFVDSVDATFAELSAKGVPFSLEPKTMKNGTRIAFCVDPTGYKIEWIENTARAA